MPPRSQAASSAPSPWNRGRIVDLLIECGRIATGYRGSMKREFKADRSIVTEADRRIEDLLTSELERPDEGVFIIGEETIERKGPAYIEGALRGTTYIVDPIDGTAPYSHDLPYWGVSIGRMVAGRITDGAVYLPEIREGELLLTDGEGVVEGRRQRGAWSWRELESPEPEEGPGGLIAIAQDLAKQGQTDMANPVQALGTAVFALVGIVQGRFLAYIGKLRLWDVAGCLPMLDRLGFSVTHYESRTADPLGLEVNATHYEMDPSHPFCWGVRGGLLVCSPAQEGVLRDSYRLR